MTLPRELDDSFGDGREYTCFCAIDPQRRSEYADLVMRLLKSGRICIGLAFPLDTRESGSPFAVSLSEIFALFGARGLARLRYDVNGIGEGGRL